MRMTGLGFFSKLLPRNRRRKGMRVRKPTRSRLELETLEARTVPSATVLQTDLVSDLPGVAQFQDSNLVNPWGISQGPGPLWISDNNSGLSTIYNGQGQQQNPLDPTLPPLIVSIPTPGNPAGHTGTPNGTVFNPTILTGSPGFIISDGTHSGPAIFLFSTEDGTIVGWNPGVDPTGKFDGPNHVSAHGVLVVDHSGNNFTQPDPLKQTGAVYKGLPLATDASGRTLLYAADFRHGMIAVYDTTFNSVTTLPAGAFTDPHLPQGYAPFNVEALNNKIYATYALQNAAKHHAAFGSLTAAAKGSPAGQADAQAVVAGLDVVQIDLATLIQDTSSAASKSTIAQDRQTLNRDFATLERAEQGLAEDSHTGQHAGAAARLSAVQKSVKALDAVFADLDSHLA